MRYPKQEGHTWTTFVFHGKDSTDDNIIIESHDILIDKQSIPTNADHFLWSTMAYDASTELDDNHFMFLIPNEERTLNTPTHDITLQLCYNEEEQQKQIVLPPNSGMQQLKAIVEKATMILADEQQLKLDSSPALSNTPNQPFRTKRDV